MHTIDFIQKWKALNLSENAGTHAWFPDLCSSLDVPAPGQNTSDYTFEKRVIKLPGDGGWANVWYKGHFAWEIKGRGEFLDKAYQ